jgi:hypothetical protein
MVKTDKMSARFLLDVREFLEENKIGRVPEELAPLTFLKYWLEWNGIVGYSDEIVELMEQLGWSRG